MIRESGALKDQREQVTLTKLELVTELKAAGRESSVHEGSNDNDGSICGSDSAFYKQSEGHSMAETLTVALRVAEEAIEEAIAKAEEFSDSLIIQRRKHSEMQTEYDFVWPQPQSLIQPGEPPSPSQPHTSAQGPQDPLKTSYSLWVSLYTSTQTFETADRIN
ncbi:hypothetical protein F2P81_019269 [Scophthalmus maximus]|uniref:Rab effector MyRIP/Melanophilin domain-containing protein n=1 Tax=Scophthalmus maximus TaxID=52904 RepID=A0A6A4SC13_SCOMX|nr:hypothetical protein F2P81_019269 [Scophthalmus maximus]